MSECKAVIRILKGKTLFTFYTYSVLCTILYLHIKSKLFKWYLLGPLRFGADVVTPAFWRRRFGAGTFWRRDVLAPRRFGAETIRRRPRHFGAKNFWRQDVLAQRYFGAQTFWRRSILAPTISSQRHMDTSALFINFYRVNTLFFSFNRNSKQRFHTLILIFKCLFYMLFIRDA